MTVDVEDYFHASAFDHVVPRARWDAMEGRVVDNTSRLLRLLGDKGVTGTFFVLGWVAERHPDLVKRIVAAGHELASHGFGHRLVYELSPDAFRWDVRRSKDLLEQISGVPVRGYRAPSFSITERSLWALDILIEEGYRYDASIYPIRHDRYGIPLSPRYPYVLERAAGRLTEVPGSTVRLGGVNFPVAGGGYFRLLPYAWTRFGIRSLNRRDRLPAIFYLHPWEIDPRQPRMPVGAVTRWRHYRNLDRTADRLTRLLSEFRFAPLSEVLERVDVAAGEPIGALVPEAG